ncbi:MAG TPA: transporter substrate-binding domain-containing protein [Stellaceae bacterium]|nr:transporter substrate-binding domain-containing protein [Stellaceae bacterium]
MLSRREIAKGAMIAAALAPPLVASQALIATPASAQNQPTESTMDRVSRTKVLRIAALPGESPYFNKDITTGVWTGMAVEMAKDIAANLDATLEYTESTYGNSVLDLQSGKIDLAFALNPTPKRALVIGFTHPVFLHGFGMVGSKGFTAKTWSDLNKPEVRVAVDIGSAHEIAARRFAPKATITGYKMRDDCILALQSGKVDCVILAAILGLTAVKKNPNLGAYVILSNPLVQLPSGMGVRQEPDKRWRDFLDNWVDYNRGIGQIREWMIGGLALNGVMPEDVPAEVQF